MNVTCSKCGKSNRVRHVGGGEIPRCDTCFTLLDVPEAVLAPRARIAWIPLLLWLLLCAGAVAWDLQTQARRFEALRQQALVDREAAQAKHQLEVAAQGREHQARIEALKASHRAIVDDPDLASGASAERAHAQEWEARLRRDRQYAKSPLEMNLLAMELAARDSSLTVAQSLFQVASLAAPPKSKVEVTPEGKRFKIRIAFDMAALSWEEAGGKTKHDSVDSLRSEAETMSARVIRDVLASVGGRDIERLSVACNRSVQAAEPKDSAPPEDPTLPPKPPRSRMTAIFRVGIDQAGMAGVADWRSATIAQIGRMVRVEFDMTRRLQLSYHSGDLPGASEPEGELEF